jgi:hypothetical protein
MSDKLIDYIVWQVAKWYLRRRLSRLGRKVAIGALAGGLIAGAVAVAHAARSGD